MNLVNGSMVQWRAASALQTASTNWRERGAAWTGRLKSPPAQAAQ